MLTKIAIGKVANVLHHVFQWPQEGFLERHGENAHHQQRHQNDGQFRPDDHLGRAFLKFLGKVVHFAIDFGGGFFQLFAGLSVHAFNGGIACL